MIFGLPYTNFLFLVIFYGSMTFFAYVLFEIFCKIYIGDKNDKTKKD